MPEYMLALLFTLLTLTANIQAQSTKPRTNLANTHHIHEVKINLLYLLDPIAAIEYEYIMSKSNTSVGISLGRSIGESIDVKYQILPFYRMYFTKSGSIGFFGEIHGIIYRESERFWHEPFNAHGMGLTIGGKFLRDDKIIAEVVGGIGRVLHKYHGYYETYYPRIAINLGYRI